MLVRLNNIFERKIRFIPFFLFNLLFLTVDGFSTNRPVLFCGDSKNDLYVLLEKEGFKIKRYKSPLQAIAAAETGAAVFIVSDTYPQVDSTMQISPQLLETARRKKLKLYIEYPSSYPGLVINEQPIEMKLERAVVTSNVLAN